MEDGFPLFDQNDESARAEQRLREYYEEFSANARQRLMAKSISRPTSVYDVLYPETREALLSKNTPINTDLEEDAKIIRDRLIAKIVTEETSLEKMSEDFRKSLLSRAKIQEDNDKLTRDGDVFRKNLLSKNSTNETNIEKDSELYRRENISKNKVNPSLQDNIDKVSSTFREDSLSKNVPKEQDLLRDSEAFLNQYRKNDINKNYDIKTDLEKDSIPFRANNTSNNISNSESIDDFAAFKRDENISKNVVKKTDIETDSEFFRSEDLSKNKPKDQDLLRDSESIRNNYRENDLKNNVPNKSDIEMDSLFFRRNNISKNTDKKTDLEKDSEIYRSKNTSNTKKSSSSIDSISEEIRLNNISKNKLTESNLETDSISFRKDDLSKNNPSITDLEVDSLQFRIDDLSLNKSNISDLETDSSNFRKDDLSKNKPVTTDLDKDSVLFRENALSTNKLKESDLAADSLDFRIDDLSKNKRVTTNLEVDSVPFRKDDLSKNKPVTTNLENDSVEFRKDDLSLNKAIVTNLETDSIPFRDSDLSLNVPKSSDLETDSSPFREDDLAYNVPKNSDLLSDSEPFRDDVLSFNVPSVSDLASDSTPFLYNNISANVPNQSDLETDSIPFRLNDLSANVANNSNLLIDSATFREDDLSSNVSNTTDLLAISEQFRNEDLSVNVPNPSNLYLNSTQLREDNLSANVPNNTDLLQDSNSFRQLAMSKNEGFGLLGVNVDGAGTSSFLGISRVFTQGILLRQLLLSKNQPSTNDLGESGKYYRTEALSLNMWVPRGSQTNGLSELEYPSYQNSDSELVLASREATGELAVRANYHDDGALYPGSPTKRMLQYIAQGYEAGSTLQFAYGTYQPLPGGDLAKTINLSFNDSVYSINRLSPLGGSFDSAKNTSEVGYWYLEGSVITNARKYNLERNSYNLKGIQSNSFEGLNFLQNADSGLGFKDLIAKTIGSLDSRTSKSTQFGTNTTPLGVIQSNEGAYFKGGNKDTDILKPNSNEAELGSAESMMAKTAVGNPFEDEDFEAGRRGVKYVINTIKNGNTPLSKNYDPQNNKVYVTGKKKDGSARTSRQKFTVANPYAPSGAEHLVFYLKNYSSDMSMFFPPYIQSIQNSETASWNTTNFLGRPEAVYTYNNSSRDASISFYVLTDYAQSVTIGSDWSKDGVPEVKASIDRHFTQSESVRQSDDVDKLKKDNDDMKKQSEELQAQIDISESQNGTDNSELKNKLQELKSNIAKNSKELGEKMKDLAVKFEYRESGIANKNVYSDVTTRSEDSVGSDISTTPGNTINRINDMRKNLMFQPSFFSGDKVDFVRRVEFLSKMTRPSKADNDSTGFSFTKPPICHIKLGTWWDHDIVVNSVSYDYADAPWTLDGESGGRVQPMWALVSINFNIIGPYGSTGGRPPLSTDSGGMYSPMGSI